MARIKIDSASAIKDNLHRMQDLKEFFAEVSGLVNKELDWLIPEEGSGPRSLREAMRWSLFAGGKHFRPSLVFAVGRAFGAPDEKLVRAAASVEMIHTYSLIHDDLPSMDDDDLRRGRETCHKKFGEATAILAGDALQALSFQAIAEDERLSNEIRLDLLQGLSRAAARMVVGQQLDLEAEGRLLTLEEVERIHANKTGALIAFSATAGATIAGTDDSTLDKVKSFASKLGLLFQVTDDLLDITATTQELGKTAGKDIAAAKATYPSVSGVDEARSLAESVHSETLKVLDAFGARAEMLRQLGDFILYRDS